MNARSAAMGVATAVAPGVAAPGINEDIRDIRGPVAIRSDWLLPAAIAVAALLLVLLAVLGGRRWRRRPRTVRVPPPEEIALEQLEAARALLAPERAQEFASAVTAAVRGYLEARYGVAAPRQTTEEFLHSLLGGSGGKPLTSHAPLLEDLLRRNDLVKFARAPLAAPEMEAMLGAAIRFVRESAAAAAEAA